MTNTPKPRPQRASIQRSVRLAPRAHYALARAAALGHRTASAQIHHALERDFAAIEVFCPDGKRTTLDAALSVIWDPDPARRLVRLMLSFPVLATAREVRVWHMILHKEEFWRVEKNPYGKIIVWNRTPENIRSEVVMEAYGGRF